MKQSNSTDDGTTRVEDLDRLVADNLSRRGLEISQDSPTRLKTALVVQGGGMRGTYSMAALMALEECGLGGAFDHVLGASAGAINGAYLLAEQAKMAVTVYLDDISNTKFVSFRRLWKVVDIDYLVDGVLKAHKALNVKRVMESRAEIHITLTDFSTGAGAVVTNRDRGLDLMEALRATAAMPILYNRPVTVNGREYIDGGLTDGIPLKRAIDLGCTDILVVLTRDPSFRRVRPNFWLRLIERLFLSKYPELTRRAIFSEPETFNEAMKTIENRVNEKNVRIAVVYPSDMSKMVSRTTNDRSELLDCALMARNDMRRLLRVEPVADNPF